MAGSHVTYRLECRAARPDRVLRSPRAFCNSSYSLHTVFALISWDQKHVPIIEPFSQASKTQIALLNIVQVYCYENTKVMKAFPQVLKVNLTLCPSRQNHRHLRRRSPEYICANGRFCTMQTVYQIKALYIGIRKAPSPMDDSISSRQPSLLSRYSLVPIPWLARTPEPPSFRFCKSRKTKAKKNRHFLYSLCDEYTLPSLCLSTAICGIMLNVSRRVYTHLGIA